MATFAPRSLADQLRGFTAAQLVALLEARPELASPPPTDISQLASRAVVGASVQAALKQLTRLELEVLRIGAQFPTISTAELQTLAHASPSSVQAAIDTLVGLALLWGNPDRWRVVHPAAQTLHLPPGPPADQVAGLISALTPPAQALLRRFTTNPSVPPTAAPADAPTPMGELLHSGLIIRDDAGAVQLAWSVRLNRYDGRSTPTPIDHVPTIATEIADQDRVDQVGAGAAFELIHHAARLLEQWSHTPPRVLRNRGVGVRDLVATAEALHLSTDLVELLVETMFAAGLLSPGHLTVATSDQSPGGPTYWLPTPAADQWLELELAPQWVQLAQAWYSTPRLIGVAHADADVAASPAAAFATSGQANVLAQRDRLGWLPTDRQTTLAQLTAMPIGSALATGTGAASVVERLRWHHPLRPATRLAITPQYLFQAAALGITGLNGLTSFGRALLTGNDAVTTLAPLLPAPVEEIIVQADLTALAPGPLPRPIEQRLQLMAHVESPGAATLYRFTSESLLPAFQAGWTSAEILEWLTTLSATPLPQPLSVLVTDVARRFGSLRISPTTSVITSSDATALARILRSPDAAKLGLRRLSDTVVAATASPQQLQAALHRLGMTPLVEDDRGATQPVGPRRYRADAAAPVVTTHQDRARARAHAQHVAAHLTEQPPASNPDPQEASSLADILALLRHAAETGQEVRVRHLDPAGQPQRQLLRPRRAEAGLLLATKTATDELVQVSLHRIDHVAVVPRP